MASQITSTEPTVEIAVGVSAKRLPPLETGDRLSRPEFERRYEAMPNLKKAELIEGVVFVGPPISELHSDGTSLFVTLLNLFALRTPGLKAGDNCTVRLDLENEVQPDVFLRRVTGGTSIIGPEGYVEGPPELITEVATSSVSRDLHSKLRLYRRHGVREYIVWRSLDRELDCFVLKDGDYVPFAPGNDGIYRSLEFPGLWLDVAAIQRGDGAAALETLNRGWASPEHAELVARLATGGSKS